MCSETAITEDDVKLWLHSDTGSEAQAEQALKWIHSHYGDRIFAFLDRHLPGLPFDHKEMALSQTYEDLWNDGRKRTLDIERSLDALVLMRAYRRAVDLMRGHTRKKRTLPPEEYHEELAKAIHSGSLQSIWTILDNKGLAQQLMDEFKAWLGTLPTAQRRIAYIMADGFPDILGPQDIHEILMETDSAPPSYETVKHRRTEVLDKFRAAIRQKYKEVLS